MAKKEKQNEISWTAPEFIHYPKSPLWFFLLTVVGLGLVMYFLWQKDFLTAMMFTLLFVIVFYFAKTRPKTVKITLDGRGVKLNDSSIPYQQIKNFWIVYDPPTVKILNFETNAYLNRFLTLQLEDEDPIKIREFLLQYLPEELNRQEQLSSKISRTLKF